MKQTIITLAVPAFLALIAIELLVGRLRGRHAYRLENAVTSLSIGLLSQVWVVCTLAIRRTSPPPTRNPGFHSSGWRRFGRFSTAPLPHVTDPDDARRLSMPVPGRTVDSMRAMLPSPANPVAQALLDAARTLCASLAELRFSAPVTHVYNPLTYAWAPYEAYVRRFGATRKRIVLLGMNPGPYGMMQTGVPFGEVAAVRDWLGIDARVERPAREHPARPILGFGCPRSEVSGRRLWGWAALRYGTADAFFSECFVLNYCPLVWLEAGGRNRTPVQLPADELKPVYQACDRHLAAALTALAPQWAIGIGGFAQARLRAVLTSALVDGDFARHVQVDQILHPSPASPAANRGWVEAVDARFGQLGIFPPR